MMISVPTRIFVETTKIQAVNHGLARERSACPRAGLPWTGQVGVTLIELLVTLSVAAILLSLAAPSFQDMFARNRVASLTNELASSLNLARSEAIKRGTTVTVCKSANVTATNPSCSTSAVWQNGWLIFVDNNTQGTVDGSGATADIPLKIGQPLNSNAVISGGANFGNYLSYLPSGVSKGSGGLATGTFTICIAPEQRRIVISNTGRIRLEQGTCP